MRIELKLARHYASRLIGLQLDRPPMGPWWQGGEARDAGAWRLELGLGSTTRLQLIVRHDEAGRPPKRIADTLRRPETLGSSPEVAQRVTATEGCPQKQNRKSG